MRATLAMLVILGSISALATEPEYCQPDNFLKKEFTVTNKKLKRLHAFKLGKMTLVGLGVGQSSTNEMEKLAVELGQVDSSNQYCTWYFNSGNLTAQIKFRHIYLPNPRSLKDDEFGEYVEKIGNEFGRNALSFVSCADQHKFIAMGCNGMKHRGPTVFGMLLAYSGCSPQNASVIVNTLWGLNGIKEEVRLAVIQTAYDLGNREPTYRDSLKERFSP